MRLGNIREKSVDPQYLSFYPYYARHGQDRYLDDHIFHHKKNGVFVDLGAYDGIESSNTLYFEESLDWGGVCVEPLPDAFARLRLNRRCLCMNACASDSYRLASLMHVMPGKPAKRSQGERVSNYEKLSGLVEFFPSEHYHAIDRVLIENGGTRELLTVPCVPVNDILGSAPSAEIDVLSLDTEGSELHILKSVDFSQFDIHVIVVEVLYPTDELIDFMKQQSYEFVDNVGYDWIYRKVAVIP
jgi:FkbM family methyltransferase